MTKSQIADHLAKKADIKKTQAAAMILDEIAKPAYKEVNKACSPAQQAMLQDRKNACSNITAP